MVGMTSASFGTARGASGERPTPVARDALFRSTAPYSVGRRSLFASVTGATAKPRYQPVPGAALNRRAECEGGRDGGDGRQPADDRDDPAPRPVRPLAVGGHRRAARRRRAAGTEAAGWAGLLRLPVPRDHEGGPLAGGL